MVYNTQCLQRSHVKLRTIEQPYHKVPLSSTTVSRAPLQDTLQDIPMMERKQYDDPTGVRAKSLVRGLVLEDDYIILCWGMQQTITSPTEEKEDLSEKVGPYYVEYPSHSCETGSTFSLSSISDFVEVKRPAFSNLVQLFQNSVIYASDGSVDDIDTAALLRACSKLEDEMRHCGFSMVAGDFRQNIQKVVRVFEHAPKLLRKTLVRLLAYEKASLDHRPSRHKIRDPSAAIGLLWIQRNLSFQCQMYENAFVDGLEPTEAALQAYHSDLEEHHHSWALRKLFTIALSHSVPKCKRTFLAVLNGFNPKTFSARQEADALQAMRSFVMTMRPILGLWEQIYEDLGLRD